MDGQENTEFSTENPDIEIDAAPNGSAEALRPIALAAKTLAGDVRDQLLDIIREMPDAWRAMDRTQQRRLADRVEFIVGTVVEKAVGLIAAAGFPAINVGLEQLTFKPKGVEAKLSMSALDRQRRHELVDAQGKVIILVVAESSVFRGRRGPAQVDATDERPAADEPKLPLGAGHDVEGISKVGGQPVEGAADGIDLDAEVEAAETAPEPPRGARRRRAEAEAAAS